MKNIKCYPIKEIEKCIKKLYDIQLVFLNKYNIDDIFSNSKFYEIIIANQLNHTPIPGHSGSRDAKDKSGMQYEYKHFKETSSNHSWTFNDYTNNLIQHMNTYAFIFAHINDKDFKYPGIMDWYYKVDGKIIKKYLTEATKAIKNARKMINVSPNQLNGINLSKTECDTKIAKTYKGGFQKELLTISNISHKLEKLTGVDKILTSNKLYELLVAMKLNHFVNAEQGGREGAYDAYDNAGNKFEYKVYKSRNWNFQDISDSVLNKYYDDKEIYLAVVDKEKLVVKEIYSATPEDIVPILRKKLKEKIKKATEKGKSIRRKQVSITFKDISKLKSFKTINFK